MGIFEPFKAIGYITSGVPFSVQRLGTETFVTEGGLQLWNVSTKKMLHEFKGWGSSVSSCVSSPALDVVAVGCADGKIHVRNIRYDEEVVTFSHSTRGAVTALSFSSDGQPLLASGGSSGVISIWNLEKRKLQSVVREAHDSSIISLHFLANEPVLMSSSADNSIKMWVFDSTDGDPRLLRFRSGHSAPPLCIRFYANGRHILSAGSCLSLFSVIQDQQSTELSQRHVSKRAKKLRVKEEELKLKPVIAFDCAEIRERDWCNVVTCHMDTVQAYVWRLQNFVIGEHILRPCPEKPTPVKACTISACGNFAILGTAGGWIERFNLQSGISRGSYLDVSERGSHAHEGEVVGVACDSTNTLMISAGYHGDVRVWDFKGRALKSRWEVGCSLVKIVYHRLNGLLATLADDLVICLFDAIALRMVRKFEGHTDRIIDLCFSEDGKWLLSSSMDETLRILDAILARQIDAVHVEVSVTALSLSPNMDVLATTHVDQNGVYFVAPGCSVWILFLKGVVLRKLIEGDALLVNQSMFSRASRIDAYASGKEVVNVKLPSLIAVEGSNAENQDTDKSIVKHSVSKEASTFPAFSQQIPDLVTLSLLPKSQWQSLINLDIIKVRNKPIEPPKKPEKTPFFLPSIPSLSGEILFKPSEPVDGDDSKPDETESDRRKLDIPPTQFLKLLQSSSEMKNFSAFTQYIKGLSPSNLDMELRMFQIIDDYQEELETRPDRNNFEFVQTVIRLFLKIHGETIRCNLKLAFRDSMFSLAESR
ncbi:LOW QUALITY PROTEIN: U3 small nucleolar RNA-associated protein 21 [Populus alba x Populus x berolinensis]|nr:LOW QUALITY PROTEIN: U3 small nucleolar RNA-associated protein 21 [Populus alba x Populus x berolinensis]